MPARPAAESRSATSVVSIQRDASSSRRVTSCVCSACPARCATMLASRGRPTSARSPIRSSALCRPNSSAKRSGPEYGCLVEHDGIRKRTAANQPHLLQADKILQKPESARRSEFTAERLAIDRHFNILRPYGWMPVVNEALDPKFISGIDADAAVTIANFERLRH